MDLRIALTVLPVGPRGQGVLDNNTSLWFALQISAGFSQAAAPEDLERLWPWVLHVVHNDQVALRAWVVGKAGVDHASDVPPVDGFVRKFRESIKASYANADVRSELDLRLLLPEEVAPVEKEQHERTSFSARLQYLATLPGELARRLLATVYVKIPVADLFTRDVNNVWQPNGATLWIAPQSVNGSAEVVLAGDPVAAGGRFQISAVDNGSQIVALGPGFALAEFVAARADVFDLTTYQVPVSPGDRRFIDLESLLLNALDLFGELHAVNNSDARVRMELISTTGVHRAVTAEAFDVLVDAWRVRALADVLSAQFPTVLQELLVLLLPTGETKPTLTIPQRWGSTLATELAESDLLTLADTLATRIGIAHAKDRATLDRVAECSGFAQVARLVAQAFDDTLNATVGVPDSLRRAWRFSGDLTLAQLAERRATLAMAAVTHVRERTEVAPLLPKLATTGVVLRDEVLVGLQERWHRRGGAFVEVLIKLGLAANEEIAFANDLPRDAAAAYLDATWPTTMPAGPELPGRGLPIRLGAAGFQLVHEDNATADQPYREVAGVLLLARRGAKADIEQRPWRIITGGAALVGELGRERLFVPALIDAEEWLHELLAIPLRPVFQQQVARAEVEYHGQPMLAKSMLDHAYAAEDYVVDDIDGFASAYPFQSVGSFEQELAGAAIASRAPALRNGDVYQFRAGVIDQAGGLPSEVASDAEPWRLDLAKLVAPTAVGVTTMPYLRRVPPGEVNVLPTVRWDAVPEDVTLRVREFWAVDHRDADSVPVVLLTPLRRDAAFTLVPPSVDEHTLLRWAMPPLDDPNGANVIADLKIALTALLDRRARQAPVSAQDPAVSLHDPAVTKLGIRIRAGCGDNTVVDLLELAIEPAPTGTPFQRAPIQVHVTAAAFGGVPQAQGSAAGVAITLPEGCFAILEVFPLIARTDYDSRFIAFEKMTDDSEPFAGEVAFHPTVVLLETWTDRLPSAEALLANLHLVEQNGDIAVRFDGAAVEHLAFVDRFSIERERWVWRNLPVVPAGSLTAGSMSIEERRRLAASGPPADVFVAAQRDSSAAVTEWERVAAIDRGFADRGEVTGRWPRVSPDARSAGGPGNGVLLFTDNRDGVAAADYLRFGLRVRSRYAGVLAEGSRERRAPQPRRIVTGFRGDKIKPPKILGIVPLTASLESDPLQTPPGITPFLVLLDETFFREYGVGERLELNLSLENIEIGEDPMRAQLPYRTGPLPDHWLADKKSFLDLKVTLAEDELAPIALDLFGPFGYSLDITPSEALANASAFVAYPPGDVGAHWSMFVRLRRLLDRPSNQQASAWSDVHALYTLPDTRLLEFAVGARPRIEIAGTIATLRDLCLILDPTARGKNGAASTQYRYFLLVSRVVAGAGLGFDAEIPAGLWRMPLFKPSLGYQPPGEFAVEFGPGETLSVEMLTPPAPIDTSTGDFRGRVLEVMLNGRYEGPSRIDRIAGWTEFWKSILNDALEDEVDAGGMIRRVSEWFPVVLCR